MKIECTDKEKEMLIMFMETGTCPFDSTHCSEENFCKACLEKNVEWTVIRNEKQIS